MKKLMVSALLLGGLGLSGFPTIARAEIAREAQAAVDSNSSTRPAERAPVVDASGEAADYAAREAATPALGEWTGGGRGERMPSENEIAAGRFQGRHVAQIAKKLSA